MEHELYMHRAIWLAQKGLGSVSPNPMVGCVVVHEGKVIGEGWHQKFGEAHAEVKAIEDVKDKELLKSATVYVTLEPCSYVGKTPACSDLLIRSKVQQVVVASLDPNPKVSGEGVRALKQAGIGVVEGVCEKEAMMLNKRFFINQKLDRPYVVLKWAQTKDRFIARSNFSSKWISNELSRQRVHQWRAEEDAVLVGKNTALHDNPSLTVRDWTGSNPVRVVLDRQLELSPDSKLFNLEAKTIVYNHLDGSDRKGNELVQVSATNFLPEVLANLYRRNIGSVIIEGGSKIINSFLQADLWDEARVFTSDKKFEEGIKAPVINEYEAENEELDNDQLSYYYNNKSKKYWQKN